MALRALQSVNQKFFQYQKLHITQTSSCYSYVWNTDIFRTTKLVLKDQNLMDVCFYIANHDMVVNFTVE